MAHIHSIDIEGTIITLKYGDIIDELDIDEITGIDYSNLFAEAISVPVLMNRVGQWRAVQESVYQKTKLKLNIFEAKLRSKYRTMASKGGGKITFMVDGARQSVKLTENSLKEAVTLNVDHQKISRELITAEKDLGYLDSLKWAVADKARKLDNFTKQVTPQEFLKDLTEGKINSILVKKTRIKPKSNN